MAAELSDMAEPPPPPSTSSSSSSPPRSAAAGAAEEEESMSEPSPENASQAGDEEAEAGSSSGCCSDETRSLSPGGSETGAKGGSGVGGAGPGSVGGAGGAASAAGAEGGGGPGSSSSSVSSGISSAGGGDEGYGTGSGEGGESGGPGGGGRRGGRGGGGSTCSASSGGRRGSLEISSDGEPLSRMDSEDRGRESTPFSISGQRDCCTPSLHLLQRVILKVRREEEEVLAQTPVVLRPAESVHRAAPASSGKAGHSESGTDSPSTARVPSAQDLEVERQALAKLGYSQGVLSTLTSDRRRSTNRVYGATWRVFATWCSGQRVDPCKPRVRELLEFLQSGLEKGLSMRAGRPLPK